MTNFSGETILINFERDLMEAVLTSFSESLRRFVNIQIKETSATSLPNDSARSAKIWERVSRTLHDLSSVAAMMIGRVCYLFSSFVKHFPSNFKDCNPSTRTRSCSSLISYLSPPRSSCQTYSFSTTLDISPMSEATARLTIGVSSEQSSVNLVLIFYLCAPLLQ